MQKRGSFVIVTSYMTTRMSLPEIKGQNYSIFDHLQRNRITKLTLLDWQAIEENQSQNLIGNVTLGDIINTNSFKKFFNDRVSGNLQNNSSFCFTIRSEKGQIIMDNIIIDEKIECTKEKIMVGDFIRPERFCIYLPDISKCEACGKIYTKSKSDQRFCSKNCQDRIKMRRWRASKK